MLVNLIPYFFVVLTMPRPLENPSITTITVMIFQVITPEVWQSCWFHINSLPQLGRPGIEPGIPLGKVSTRPLFCRTFTGTIGPSSPTACPHPQGITKQFTKRYSTLKLYFVSSVNDR